MKVPGRLVITLVSALISVSLTLKPQRAEAKAQTRSQNGPTATSPELERRDQPVTDEDLRILRRADSILSSPAVWNRNDTRICKPEDTTWSLFCAMQKAAIDLLGEERYRAVALQEVRFVVEDEMKASNVPIQHRLTDYNNLPSTRFEDIKNALTVAAQRVSARLASKQRTK